MVLHGQSPYQYTYEKCGNLNRIAYLNVYNLVSDDSFDVGEAYPLHLTAKDAENYRSPHYWWRKEISAKPIFVSKKTKEAMKKLEDKCTWSSWMH